MELYNIIKPDMICDEEALDYYFRLMKSDFGINVNKMYYLDDWIYISKLIYELDLCNMHLDSETIIQKRKQLLTTILGYYLFYRNKYAVISIFDVDLEQKDILKDLECLKKELRRRFVLKTDKYYLKILNESEIDYSLPLTSINLDNIKVASVVVDSCQEFNNPDYQMIFFNKLHFPDPDVCYINKELCAIKETNLFKEQKCAMRYR